MDIQLWVIGIIFGLAIAYLLRKYILQLKGKKQAGCEKCSDIK